MRTTRAFKSGNSQAVRIPAELADADISQELTITRTGDVFIAPARDGLGDAMTQLRAMAKPDGIEAREPIGMPDRGWN